MTTLAPLRGAVWGIGLTVAVLASGCIRPDEPAGDVRVTPQFEIKRMLDRRADALLAGDTARFMHPVVGRARKLERDIATGIRDVPIAGIHLRLREVDIPRKGDEVRSARVDFAFWFDELPDDNLFHILLKYDLARRGQRWVITGSELDTDEGELDPEEANFRTVPLWLTERVQVYRSRHFLAFASRGVPGVPAALRLAQRARKELTEDVSFQLDPKHVIEFPADQNEFRALFVTDDGDEDDDQPPDALAYAEVEYFRAGGSGMGDLRAENRHMVVNLDAIVGPQSARRINSEHGGYDDALPLQVFRHELGHLTLAHVTSIYTPAWVSEGAAMVMAGERRQADWAAGLAGGEFDGMSIENLTRISANASAYDYAYANAAVEYLVNRHGIARWWRFYAGFDDFTVPEPRSITTIRLDRNRRLLNLIYDTTERRLDAAVLRWMERNLAS